MSLLTNTDIAETWEGLGQHAKAREYRALDEPDPDAITVEELSFAVEAVLNQVPSTDRGKHDDECWKKHAACLAERVLELLP